MLASVRMWKLPHETVAVVVEEYPLQPPPLLRLPFPLWPRLVVWANASDLKLELWTQVIPTDSLHLNWPVCHDHQGNERAVAELLARPVWLMPSLLWSLFWRRPLP